MRIQRYVVPVVVAAIVGLSSPAFAQTGHIADGSTLQQAVQSKIASADADRAVVLRVLQTSEAQATADRLGLDLTRAQAAVATLQGADLSQLAASARAAETQLSGGSQTIVISTTTLLLVLILLVLLLK